MTNITLFNLDDKLENLLKQRAEKNGRSLEEEIKEILHAALTESQQPLLNLVTIIERRFAHLGDFELPEIPREPMRPTPTFES
jgi:plasmid stability protein